jgi:hypothetical protein
VSLFTSNESKQIEPITLGKKALQRNRMAHRSRSSRSPESKAPHVARQGTAKGYKLSGTKRHVWRFLRADLDAALLDNPGDLA